MKLVIGGAYQGKTDAACQLFGYAKENIADGSVCSLDEITKCTAISSFHLYMKRWLKENPEKSAEDLANFIISENPTVLIITNEIGYGIVPMEREERDWREFTGRVCCILAKEADTVVRVVAGVPMFLKKV